MKHIVVFIMLSLCLQSFAQKEQSYWYMGGIYGLKFDNGQRQVLPPHPNTALEDFTGYTSISDDQGNFLFQASGARVLDKNFNLMPGGDGISAAYTIVVPHTTDSLKYMVFYFKYSNGPGSDDFSIYQAEIDMRLRGGLGDITFYDNFLAKGVGEIFTVIPKKSWDGYWIITHAVGTNQLRAYEVSNGIVATASPVVSTIVELGISSANGNSGWGSMVSNKTGTLIAYTNAAQNFGATQIFLLNFDKCTGKIGLQKALNPVHTVTNFLAYQSVVAFSRNDLYLYASLAGINNLGNNRVQQIFRYDLSAVDLDLTKLTVATIVTPVTRFNEYLAYEIALAPDNNLYVTTDGGGSPKVNMSVIENVESTVPTFTENIFPFYPPKNWIGAPLFPAFVMDTVVNKRPVGSVNYSCGLDSVAFSVSKKTIFDTAYWELGDGNVSTVLNFKHLYTKEGKYTPRLMVKSCKEAVTDFFDIEIADTPTVDIGPDTLLCAGAKYSLSAIKGANAYLWSTKDTTESILLSTPGPYWVKVKKGKCEGGDTVNIAYKPPIWVELGGEFYLCEDDNQTVKLDAGKGFEAYKWTPTGDTSQWIIVKKSGPYYVVVKDFMGCQGDDGTQVTRRCTVYGEVPNAFTPNGDGLNDVFLPFVQETKEYELIIYNRWGQKLFTTKSPTEGWDGIYKTEACPDGVYFYTLTFTGYQNKVLRKYNKSGTFNLIR